MDRKIDRAPGCGWIDRQCFCFVSLEPRASSTRRGPFDVVVLQLGSSLIVMMSGGSGARTSDGVGGVAGGSISDSQSVRSWDRALKDIIYQAPR